MTNAATSFRAPIVPIPGLTAQSSDRGTSVYVPGGTGANAYFNNLVPANQVEKVVRVRIPSYLGVTLSWRFHQEK